MSFVYMKAGLGKRPFTSQPSPQIGISWLSFFHNGLDRLRSVRLHSCLLCVDGWIVPEVMVARLPWCGGEWSAVFCHCSFCFLSIRGKQSYTPSFYSLCQRQPLIPSASPVFRLVRDGVACIEARYAGKLNDIHPMPIVAVTIYWLVDWLVDWLASQFEVEECYLKL